MMLRTLALLAVLLFSLPSWAQAADAATRESARKLGDEASALFAEGNYAGALEKYQRADALVRVPTLGVRVARCLEKLGRLVEASERYLAVTRMQLAEDALPIHREAQQQAAAERAALVPRIPVLVIELRGATQGVSASIDGRVVPEALMGEQQLVDPGEHQLQARRGEQVQTRNFTAVTGQISKVELQFDASPLAAAPTPPPLTSAPPPTQPDRPAKHGNVQRTVGLVVAGVGVLGVAVGSVTGLVASGKRSDLEERCGAKLDCPPSTWGDADSYNSLRTVSGVGFIGGAVCLVAGGVLYLTAPRASAAPVLQGRGGALSFRF